MTHAEQLYPSCVCVFFFCTPTIPAQSWINTIFSEKKVYERSHFPHWLRSILYFLIITRAWPYMVGSCVTNTAHCDYATTRHIRFFLFSPKPQHGAGKSSKRIQNSIDLTVITWFILILETLKYFIKHFYKHTWDDKAKNMIPKLVCDTSAHTCPIHPLPGITVPKVLMENIDKLK